MATILVIDDELPVRQLLGTILERAGYEVILAENGEIGLRIFAERLPDVVIIDMFMPEKEGLETILALRRLSPDTRIVAISGGGRHGIDVLELAEGLGAAVTLHKPFRKEEILAAVGSAGE